MDYLDYILPLYPLLGIALIVVVSYIFKFIFKKSESIFSPTNIIGYIMRSFLPAFFAFILSVICISFILAPFVLFLPSDSPGELTMDDILSLAKGASILSSPIFVIFLFSLIIKNYIKYNRKDTIK